MPVEDKNLEKIRHSSSHVLAMAVLKLYPKAKLAIGPAIKDGFYYDFDLSEPISEDDLPKIEKEMGKIINDGLDFKQTYLSREKAQNLSKNNPYKLELLQEIEGDKISFYQTGKFLDLCRGGHVKKSSDIGAVKLLSIAGAYWRGDEKNPMLTRIYGTAFPTKKELDAHLKMRAEAGKRDHRKLGRELDLFTFSELVGPGLPLYTTKGALIRRLVNEHVENIQRKHGYHQVWTPQVNKAELFKISGHYDKYKENMFKVVSNYSDEEFFLKPMNCPQHTQIYASRSRSYRDLPLRFTDFSMLYRDEKPGELLGLARVRSFSQDDCHVFCREDQVEEEIDVMLKMTKEVMDVYGFKYRYRLSTRDKDHPEKYLGDPKIWDKVEKWAENIIQKHKIEHFDAPGEATFYAPKMDLLATDSLGREWQLSTIQIDYVMPERFGLTYVDQDGEEKIPVMLHRAIIGSPERFLMILIENYAGAFPVWLSPVQAVVIPISEKFNKYATKVFDELASAGVRAELADKDATMQAKIRNAQLQKVPYMLIVGAKEEKAGSVSVRLRDGNDLGAKKLPKVAETIVKITEEKSKKLW